MEKNTIARVLDSVAHDELVQNELLDAAEALFEDIPDAEVPQELNGEDEMLIGEWMIFEYQFSSGETLLERYIRRNPDQLGDLELKVYRDLLHTTFGLWEVLDVRRGKGMKLQNMGSREIFEIQEYSATFGVDVGKLIFARIGCVHDHWEIVGATMRVWDIHFSDNFKKVFSRGKNSWSMKKSAPYLVHRREAESGLNIQHVDPQAARENLTHVLQKYDLEKYADVSRIAEWLTFEPMLAAGTNTVSILAGLLPKDADFDEATNDIVRAVTDISNSMPRAELGGKSSEEKQGEPWHVPDIEVNITMIGNGKWGDAYGVGIRNMKQQKAKAAVRAFQDSFRQLLKVGSTTQDIYRCYANLAVCSFAVGEREKGERYLAISRELNPHYDFAKMVEERLRRGEYDDIPDRELVGLLHSFVGETRTKKRFRWPKAWSGKDYALAYYDFILPFKINFAVQSGRVSHITVASESGTSRAIGRNDPCPCGAKHEDGRPKKYKHCHGK